MKSGTVFRIGAVVALVFGLAFVLFPEQLMELYDVTLSGPTSYLGRLFGASLLGYAVITWMAKDQSESEAGRAISLGVTIADGVGFVLALLGQLGGHFNALGWTTVAVYLLLALGFGYVYFAKPAAS